MNILEVLFFKKGDMKFISHLDLVRLFQRASRRAALPVKITEGYSPHSKISILKALKLGVESSGETALLYLTSYIEPEKIKDSLNSKLPKNIQVTETKYRK